MGQSSVETKQKSKEQSEWIGKQERNVGFFSLRSADSSPKGQGHFFDQIRIFQTAQMEQFACK